VSDFSAHLLLDPVISNILNKLASFRIYLNTNDMRKTKTKFAECLGFCKHWINEVCNDLFCYWYFSVQM